MNHPSKLVSAMYDMEFTENGMPTNKTSGSANLDFFAKVGGMRGYDLRTYVSMFADAWAEDPLTAMKNLFATRNPRGGKGERKIFRDILRVLTVAHPEWVLANLHLIPHWGRWDDLFVILDAAEDLREAAALRVDDANTGRLLSLADELVKTVSQYYMHSILKGDQLAMKWAPRHGKSKWHYADTMLRAVYGYGLDDSHKNEVQAKYRRALKNTQTVEKLMSANKWDEIVLEHVPSQANLKYRKAFWKHLGEKFKAFLERVKSGVSKMHAGTLQPHEIVVKVLSGLNQDDPALQAMWDSQVNYLAEGFVPMVMADVSGSMGSPHDPNSPMVKSISMATYLSERQPGIFKDAFLTFTRQPTMEVISGSIFDRIRMLYRHSSDWGFNTDFVYALGTLVHIAQKHNVPPEEFPTHIIVLSDMQFDISRIGMWQTATDAIDRIFNTAGDALDRPFAGTPYQRPVFVFWDLRASKGVPAKINEKGYAMVSGFSPAVIEHVLGGKALVLPKQPTPQEVFELAMKDYELVVVPSEYQIEAVSTSSP